MKKHLISRLWAELKDRGYDVDIEGLTQAINSAEGKGSSERFAEFWRVFPKQRRRDRTRCLRQWTSKKLDSIADVIIEDIVNKKQNDWEWNLGFAPMPGTYLSNRRWEDEATMPQTREALKGYANNFGKSWNGPVPEHLKEEQADWVDKYAPQGGW